MIKWHTTVLLAIAFLCSASTGVLETDLLDTPIDVVSLSAGVSCVQTRAVHALNKLFPQVRTLHIITAFDNCAAFLNLSETIRCHNEDDVIQGVTLQAVRRYLMDRFEDATSKQVASERGGWYLQQLLKMGSASFLPGLSTYFLVWDLDMIPLQSFQLLFAPTTSGHPPSTRVEISSVRIGEYAYSYKRLFGREPEYPRPGMSFVAHFMLVRRSYMLDMLRALNGPEKAVLWPWNVLDSIKPGYRNVYYGLSEYAMYISWVIQNRPGTVHVAQSKQWVRVSEKNMPEELGPWQGCCPTDDLIDQASKKNWLYLGWELGEEHSPNCSILRSDRPLASSVQLTWRQRD
jgi:hypothetical protein